MLLSIEEPGASNEEKKENDVIAGIDFGTTNSLISLFDGKNSVEIPVADSNILKSEIEIEDIKIPSIKRVFGKSLKEIQENNFLPEDIKSLFYEDDLGVVYLKINEVKYYPVQIAAKIFQKLKNAAENFINNKLEKIVVTVPAYFDDAAKDLVKKSANLAGLEVVRLIAEPTAAAYFYGLDEGKEGNYIVYDLGGGTFDVSILKMRMGAFQVVATGGDSLLGGDDIDIKISNYLKNKYSDLNNIKNSDLIRESTKIKEYLQINNNYSSSKFSNKEIELTSLELDQISRDLIDKTIKICKKTIYDSKLKDFQGIILVGGSTRLNIVRSSIQSNFPNLKILDNLNPDKIVSFGAAKQGYNLSSRKGDLLIDVLPLSLGIELYGGLTEKIIYRNSSIPASETRKYTTNIDNQNAMDIHVVQGERELASDCRSLAKFKLRNIPPMVAGMAQIEVKFNVDADGLLEVSAKELSTNIEQKIEVKPSFGLDDNKMYEMLKNAFEERENDFEEGKRIEHKLDLESSLLKLKKLIDKNKDLVNEIEYKELNKVADELFVDLDSKSIKELEEIHAKLSNETDFFVERIMNKGLDVHIKGKKVENIIGKEND